MRRLTSANAVPPAAGDESPPTGESFDQDGGGARDEDARRQLDDREEKSAEINGDEEFFASGHFPVDDSSWDGLETANSSAGQMTGSAGFDNCRSQHDLLPNPNDAPIQLDNLSDFDDVIDLADLVSSDTERPSPPVAARTSLSGSFVAGPARRPRSSLRKMTAGSFARVSTAGESMSKLSTRSTRLSASQTGKRKVRSRRLKREEIATAHLEWETIRAEGTPPDQRYDCGLTLYGSLLIVVGGIVGKLRLNDMHILDLASNPSPQWIQPPISGTPPPAGNLLQIFVIGDTLYAIGGTKDGKFLSELHALNLKLGDWNWEKIEVAGTPPSMRYWYSLTVLQGMAILYGVSENSIECTWRKVETQGHGPASRYTHSGASIGSQLIIYGGNTGCLKGDAYVLDLGTALLCSVSAVVAHSSSASGSGDGSASVEFPVVGDAGSRWQHVRANSSSGADEIRFPIGSEVGSGEASAAVGVDVGELAASLSGSGGATVEFVSSQGSQVGHEIQLEETKSTDNRNSISSKSGMGSLSEFSGTSVGSNDGSWESAAVTAPPLVDFAETVNGKALAGSSHKDLSTAHLGGSVALNAPSSTEESAEMHGVPSNPTLVTAVAYDGRATVSWKAPEDDGLNSIVAYEVGWFDEDDNVLVGTQTVTSSSVKFADLAGQGQSASNAVEGVPTSTIVGPLVNGRSYTFKVRARNVNGFSVWSAKSRAVSPLHPPDLCERLSCSGHGTCFPNYHNERSGKLAKNRELTAPKTNTSNTAIDDFTLDAVCICRPGYSPPDCSAKTSDDLAQYTWKVSEWSECDSGCGGGTRSREVQCFDVFTNDEAPSEEFCASIEKPSASDICNGIECGSKRVIVKYEVEMSYDERGSIVVYFQILPASRVGEKSLNDIVENLQDQLNNATSTLRTMGTFARRIEVDGAKLSFSIADQTVAGGAEDISIAGLIGTVLVLGFFVSVFGWFLRRRHEHHRRHYRLLQEINGRVENTLDSPRAEMDDGGMKRMNIRNSP
ncbi:unnamed protein product [Phytophthora lilii]|uniref:Unnamed protein product n=1 Tax=Phytophthora lilii TaxID=2077276 RepID=A0A9W6TDW3_9STRA|nr:unnamed protein product [Phytophthora lilii]